ncbi:MNIO family bufferin maturase [Photobacterium alginatilyticum]|uniref:UPF0276 protein EIZ48_20760 n=1 Tax=Photobacterium alginatilyticum TaxID=1775171 RepID=A0ABW9YMJ7_9GAMM|nr:DUF692 domain-containing protein [Photobacterium alginatilyticum]NBI54950.1 DUF692 domain-containing protein [Photobacterium alginatilyticum]
MVGVGLRSPHITQVLEQKPDIGWLEVHSENYFITTSTARQQLRQIAEHYPVSCHGIGLSLGSADPLDRQHLSQLKQLVDEINPIAVSDHLSWSSVDGQFFNDLLPLPYTEEALVHFCRKVDQVQEYLGRQMLIENPSSYLSFAHSAIPEWEFLHQVQQRTGCGLLLDLNNIYVSAFNHGFDCDQYIAALDASAVKEIHLAGFTVKQFEDGEIWIDTHSKPVSEPVWQLYRRWVQQHGRTPTLIEWDLDIPPLSVLLGEADKARNIIMQEAQDGQILTP